MPGQADPSSRRGSRQPHGRSSSAGRTGWPTVRDASSSVRRGQLASGGVVAARTAAAHAGDGRRAQRAGARPSAPLPPIPGTPAVFPSATARAAVRRRCPPTSGAAEKTCLLPRRRCRDSTSARWPAYAAACSSRAGRPSWCGGHPMRDGSTRPCPSRSGWTRSAPGGAEQPARVASGREHPAEAGLILSC